jgi:hypothetical protein
VSGRTAQTIGSCLGRGRGTADVLYFLCGQENQSPSFSTIFAQFSYTNLFDGLICTRPIMLTGRPGTVNYIRAVPWADGRAHGLAQHGPIAHSCHDIPIARWVVPDRAHVVPDRASHLAIYIIFYDLMHLFIFFSNRTFFLKAPDITSAYIDIRRNRVLSTSLHRQLT